MTHARYDVVPRDVAIARSAVVADAEDIVQVRADTARAVCFEPTVPFHESETVEDLGVTHVVPVAGLLQREAVQHRLVLIDERNLVVVVAILEANRDSLALGRANELEKRLASLREIRLALLRTLLRLLLQ